MWERRKKQQQQQQMNIQTQIDNKRMVTKGKGGGRNGEGKGGQIHSDGMSLVLYRCCVLKSIPEICY